MTEARLIQILDERLDIKLEEKLDQKLDQKLDEKLDIKFAEFFGQIKAYFDKEFEKKADKTQVDRIEAMLHGYVERMDAADIERAALDMQTRRHKRWIKELAYKTNIQLSPP